MKNLYSIIEEEQQINEGLLKNMMSRPILNRMSSEDLVTGLLNMYDYICAGDDIEKFYMDFPRMQKMFWKNIYELYSSNAFGMFEISSYVDKQYFYDEDDEDDEDYSKRSNRKKSRSTIQRHNPRKEMTIDEIASDNELVKVTPEIRRMLRNIIDNSKIARSGKLSAADPMFIYITSDPLYEDEYRMMFTINKEANMFSRKFLEALFKKIDEQ